MSGTEKALYIFVHHIFRKSVAPMLGAFNDDAACSLPIIGLTVAPFVSNRSQAELSDSHGSSCPGITNAPVVPES